jgi:ATP-binding cassette, subfamily B, bacterial PglK
MSEFRNSTAEIVRLWLHIESFRRKQFYLLTVLMAFSSILEVVSIGSIIPFLTVLLSPENILNHDLSKKFMDYFMWNNPKDLQVAVTTIYITAVLISGIVRFLVLLVQTRLAHMVGADLSLKMYKIVLNQPYSVHISRNTSEIISVITQKSSLVSGALLLPIVNLVNAAFILSALTFVLVYANPTVTISLFSIFISFYYLLIYLTKKPLIKFGKNISKNQTLVIKSLQEGLGGIRDIILDGSQRLYSRIFRSADIDLRHSTASIVIIGTSPRFAIEVIGIIFIALLALFLSKSTDGLSQYIPLLGAIALATQRILPTLQNSYKSWTQIKGSQAPCRDVLDVLDQGIIELDEVEKNNEKLKFEKEITLKNVSYKYNDKLPYVLNNINLSIKKGQCIGIIGRSGCGKSTLVDIMMGLLNIIDGSFSIDEKEIDNKNVRLWQKHISHVPQSIFLADGTLIENIAFGVESKDINIERVQESARKAKISEFIDSLELKYNTFVGERGVRLSGGQRQRIGLARALYKDTADLLILDEATSALDTHTEIKVMNKIRELNKNLTVVIVTHRIISLKDCDMIIKIKDGQVEKIGKYEEFI